MRDDDRGAFASRSLTRHLARGAVGFGLIGSAIALTPAVGADALLLALPGAAALRGCPTCWLVGLLNIVSAGRTQRNCAGGACTLVRLDRRKRERQVL